MNHGALNVRWAYQLLDELARAGVRELQLAPGSRSTPLVLAAEAHPRLSIRVHLDERSAAFFALGLGKASGIASPIITTSGTAVANLVPAVVEADASDVPLMCLTADRPPRLRGKDANQTIDQVSLLQPFVRLFRDLEVPTADGLDGLRQTARAASEAAHGSPCGPVHLNIPFDKPLEPVDANSLHQLVEGLIGSDGSEPLAEVAGGSLGGGSPAGMDRTDRSSSHLSDEERSGVEALVSALRVARRPLLIAGPSSNDRTDGPALRSLAEASRIPLLADPLSGARFGTDPCAVAIGGYDHALRNEAVASALAPDLILRTGRSSSSVGIRDALQTWPSVPHWIVDAGSKPKDHEGLATAVISAPPDLVLSEVLRLLESTVEDGEGARGSAAVGFPEGPGFAQERERWISLWAKADSLTWEVIREGELQPEAAGHEGLLAGALTEAMPDGSTLVVSSSMPVRDVEAYGPPTQKDLRVLGNRGASGIDGIVSTVLGVTAADPDRWVVGLLGDLAFYHDMNGLLAARDAGLNALFIVVDNDGGGIFHHLPIRAFEPAFTPYFATPHGLDFEHSAKLYGIPFEDCESLGSLKEAVRRNSRLTGVRIIRYRTDREVNTRAHKETTSRIIETIRENHDHLFGEANDDA